MKLSELERELCYLRDELFSITSNLEEVAKDFTKGLYRDYRDKYDDVDDLVYYANEYKKLIDEIVDIEDEIERIKYEPYR